MGKEYRAASAWCATVALETSGIRVSHWPAPFKKTVCGLLLASSFTAIFAVLLPVAFGLNITVMLQLLPPGMVLGQGFIGVRLKSPEFVPVI
jgi:hypothetical protein